MKPTEAEPLALIDKWFAGRCDGVWEHHSGLKLETTDNPGWLMTIDEALDESVFNALSVEVRERWGAECVREQDRTRDYAVSLDPPPVQITRLQKDKISVYAASLKNCVYATAHILAARKSTTPKK
jgi:hypothetical protein